MEVHLGCKSVTYENGETTCDVLAWNHFGTETIPPRPVLRMAVEKVLSSEEFKKVMKAYAQNYAMAVINNKSDLPRLERELLRKIGSQAIAEAKRIIAAGAELQSNAPSTISHKKVDHPLFVDGTLMKALGYEIED